MQKNLFKASLASGAMQYGCWLTFADAYAAEIAATADFDWLLIDAEHAPNDVRSILRQLQAIAPYRSHPIVRPIEGSPAGLKQLLDIGVQTVLVPMIESAEQAELMARSVRYPPDGVRGVGAAVARATRWNGVAGYEEHAEEEICLLLQIESEAGLDNLDEILEVDGVDGIFIGPADLAATMGYLGQSGHPTVQKSIELAIAKILKSGRATGILSTDPSHIASYRDQGVQFIAVGVDTLLFADAVRGLAARFMRA